MSILKLLLKTSLMNNVNSVRMNAWHGPLQTMTLGLHVCDLPSSGLTNYSKSRNLVSENIKQNISPTITEAYVARNLHSIHPSTLQYHFPSNTVSSSF
jgi:hypothetical protein